MNPGTKSEIVERLFGCVSGLILVELRRFDNHTLRPFSAHPTHVENKVKAIRIAPIRAEHRHEPAAAGLIDLFYIMTRRHVSQTLPCSDLFDAKFNGRGQKYFQHMANTG